jgi:TRAP-type C4-dicarboxylate transport system permease small subunit
VLNSSPGWTEPVAVLMLATTMSLGAAAGVHARAHFAFNLLVLAASPRWRRVMQAISHLTVIAIGAMLATWSSLLLIDGLDVKMAGAPLPQSANHFPIALGGALMVLFALRHLWLDLRPTAPDGAP